MTEIKKTIYQQMLDLEVEIAHHATDLHVPVDDETTAVLMDYEFKSAVTTFVSQIDGKTWYDIPFAYLPGWGKKGGGT